MGGNNQGEGSERLSSEEQINKQKGIDLSKKVSTAVSALAIMVQAWDGVAPKCPHTLGAAERAPLTAAPASRA
jgi:hypothetical protein